MHVEPEVALERDRWGECIARKHVPEDSVVLAGVVLRSKGLVQRIELVAQATALAAGKISVDVIDRNDWLHQNALADDAFLGVPGRIVGQTPSTRLRSAM